MSHFISRSIAWRALLALAVTTSVFAQPARPQGLAAADIYKLRSVSDVQISPDGRTIVYSVNNNDQPDRPYSQVWQMDVASGNSRRLGGDKDTASEPHFSPDGKRLAFFGRIPAGSGLIVANADGSSPEVVAPVEGTNHPLPSSGDRLTWSPDGRQLAFISARPGPEEDANGDPMVITRYLYKPTASEGGTRANDNRRLHIFVADIASKAVRQLTEGNYYEHSIDWSPKGDEILFISNRGPDPDRFFNYDVFAVDAASGRTRRLTDTKSAEYYPKWSPDGRFVAFSGTKRPLTSSETTMEDTHVWVMAADGSARREVGTIDNRQGAPEWARDGKHLYFTMQERGEVRLMRVLAGWRYAGAARRRTRQRRLLDARCRWHGGLRLHFTGVTGRIVAAHSVRPGAADHNAQSRSAGRAWDRGSRGPDLPQLRRDGDRSLPHQASRCRPHAEIRRWSR